MNGLSTSPSWRLNKTDFVKVGRDFLFAIIGCILTFLSTDIKEVIENSEHPLATAVLLPIFMAGTSALWRWYRDNQKRIDKANGG